MGHVCIGMETVTLFLNTDLIHLKWRYLELYRKQAVETGDNIIIFKPWKSVKKDVINEMCFVLCQDYKRKQ